MKLLPHAEIVRGKLVCKLCRRGYERKSKSGVVCIGCRRSVRRCS